MHGGLSQLRGAAQAVKEHATEIDLAKVVAAAPSRQMQSAPAAKYVAKQQANGREPVIDGGAGERARSFSLARSVTSKCTGSGSRPSASAV